MSVYDNKAAMVKAPYGDGSTTTVLFFDCTSSSQSHALPNAWAGKIVRISNETANLAQFLVSFNSATTVNQALAAAAAGGANASLGGSIAGNTERHVQLPELPQGYNTLYFVRASATNTSLRLELASP